MPCMATPRPLLRNPALQQTHSGPTQAVLRIPIVASMPQPPSSIRAAARVTVKGAFTPNHVSRAHMCSGYRSSYIDRAKRFDRH